MQSEESILDIALKYGYASAESFTRGFRKIWGITPREYRRTRHFTGHTPKLAIPGNSPFKFMEDDIMRRVDAACAEDDICLRIGGDEFVVFTNSQEMEHANEIVKKVSAQDIHK